MKERPEFLLVWCVGTLKIWTVMELHGRHQWQLGALGRGSFRVDYFVSLVGAARRNSLPCDWRRCRCYWPGLDDVLSLPAAGIAGPIFFCAAIFILQVSPIKEFADWVRDFGTRAIRSDLRGEGAIAGAFGIALGGPQKFGERSVPRDWIGEGACPRHAG